MFPFSEPDFSRIEFKHPLFCSNNCSIISWLLAIPGLYKEKQLQMGWSSFFPWEIPRVYFIFQSLSPVLWSIYFIFLLKNLALFLQNCINFQKMVLYYFSAAQWTLLHILCAFPGENHGCFRAQVKTKIHILSPFAVCGSLHGFLRSKGPPTILFD